MLDKEKIYELVKTQGPLIPRDIMKVIGGDTFLIGALLSQLKSSGRIFVSNTKIGGSPVYYVLGQEEKLQDLYKYLHDKEKKAFDLLKKEKVLQDSQLEPVTRVALRQIKDFAKPLEVNRGGNKEIFWKWYLLENDEAGRLIKEILVPPGKEEKKPIKEEKKEPKEDKKVEEKKEQKEKTEPKDKKPVEEKQEDHQDSFYKKLKNYFDKNKIEVVSREIIRKQREIDFLIKIPSAAGMLKYYGKAINKKRCNDGDLSKAYVKGESKNLPVLFITPGKLSKRAKEMLNNEFRNINIIQIE